MHEVGQDEEAYLLVEEQYDRSFDSVNMKYLKFDNMKCIIITVLVSGTGQKGCA